MNNLKCLTVRMFVKGAEEGAERKKDEKLHTLDCRPLERPCVCGKLERLNKPEMMIPGSSHDEGQGTLHNEKSVRLFRYAAGCL